MHGVFSALGRKAPLVVAGAAVFLAGGVFVPKVVEATTSSGDRAIFEPLAPARILDTRFGPSPLAVGTPVGAGATIEVQVRGQGGVPNDATAVALNVTVTGATQQSHLTVFPGGEQAPNASNLNFGAGDTIPNAVTAKIGTNGKVAIRNNSGTVHVIADVNGYFRGHTHDDRYDTKAQVDTKIDNAQAESNYVGSGQITDGQVGNADLGGNSVTSNKIADGQVGSADLGDNSVNSAEITDGQVGAPDIQDGAVDTAEIADGAVDGGKVQDESLTTADHDTVVVAGGQNYGAGVAVGANACRLESYSVQVASPASPGDPTVPQVLNGTLPGTIAMFSSPVQAFNETHDRVTLMLCNVSGSTVNLTGIVNYRFEVFV